MIVLLGNLVSNLLEANKLLAEMFTIHYVVIGKRFNFFSKETMLN